MLKKSKFFALVFPGLLNLLALTLPAQESLSLDGYWLGTLKVAGIELRIGFNIKTAPDGAFTVTMDSIDQGVKDIPVGSAVLAQGKLTLEVPSIQGKYEGLIDAESGTISGTWTQPSGTLPLDMKRQEKPLEINRPQEPKEPFPYNATEVSYPNPQAGITLGGTLTKPRAGAPHPAVILISGSGAQDRDETIFNHRPFLVLADHLTRQGVAVLRVDDRGVGKSGGDIPTSTIEDFASDVEAGISFLRSDPDVDTQSIGLIGHSEGGIIAPLVASRNPGVAFIVLLAGTGLTGEEILYLQSELISRASGVEEKIIRQDAEAMRRIYSAVKEETDPVAAEKRIRAVAEDMYLSMTEERKKEFGDKETWIRAIVMNVNSMWFRFFLTYDPKPALEKIRCPVLALNGEKDLQVPADVNLEAIESALRSGGNKNYRLEKLPGLNHLFQTATTGSPAEYGTIEETMSPTALKIIGDWILEVAAKTSE